MCLCWNDDGSMCSPGEVMKRIDLHMKGLYKPELWKASRERMEMEKREAAERVAALTPEQKSDLISSWKTVFGC